MSRLIVPFFAEATGWTVEIDGVTYRPALVDSNGHVQVDVLSSALPAGAATLAEQQTQTTALQLIDDLRNALASIGADELRVGVTTPYTPIGIQNAAATVGVPGAPVQLGNVPCRAISVKALPGNTGNIYVGRFGVVSAATGYILRANEAVDFAIDNANRVWIDADNAGEGIRYLMVTDS